jgi:hypothetical protein
MALEASLCKMWRVAHANAAPFDTNGERTLRSNQAIAFDKLIEQALLLKFTFSGANLQNAQEANSVHRYLG